MSTIMQLGLSTHALGSPSLLVRPQLGSHKWIITQLPTLVGNPLSKMTRIHLFVCVLPQASVRLCSPQWHASRFTWMDTLEWHASHFTRYFHALHEHASHFTWYTWMTRFTLYMNGYTCRMPPSIPRLHPPVEHGCVGCFLRRRRSSKLCTFTRRWLQSLCANRWA